MPTYTYIRRDGTTFEVVQKMKDKPLTTYKGKKCRRIPVKGTAVHFKGTGWTE